jgi:hypothetical protein
MAAQKKSTWLDDEGGVAIDDSAKRLESYVKALADGKVTAAEVAEQEKRVAALMRDLEPRLDERLHADVTKLLCELTVFDILQLLHTMQDARPKSRFRG